MKPLLFFLIAIIGATGSVKSQITNDSLRKLRNYNDSFVKTNFLGIRAFIHKNMAVSKLTCYDKYIVKDQYKKIRLWGILSEYTSKYSRRERRFRYKLFKKNKDLLANMLLEASPGNTCCYYVNRLNGYRNLGFIDTLFPDYIFLKAYSHYGYKCRSWPANTLPFTDSGNYISHRCQSCFSVSPFFKSGPVVAISKTPEKPNLIFSEEFCYTDTNWRFLFREFIFKGKIYETPLETSIQLYLELYLLEYFDLTNGADPIKIEFIKKKGTTFYYQVKGICCMHKEVEKQYKSIRTNIKLKINSETGDILGLKRLKKAF